MSPSPQMMLLWEQASKKATKWLCPSEAYKIAQMAHELREDNPNAFICSLGQSPAWIIRAAEIEAELVKQPIKTTYIAHSNSMFQLKRHKEGAYFYEFDNECAFGIESGSIDIARYRNYLETLSVSPKAIVDRFQKNLKTTTTIVDYFQSGRGVATFLYVLFSWAKECGNEELLRQALAVHLYIKKDTNPPLAIKIKGFKPIPCARRTIDRAIRNRLWACWDEVRIVPGYPYYLWHKPPGPPEGTEAFISKTTQILQEAVIVNNLAPNLYERWARNGRSAIENILARSLDPAEPKSMNRAASERGPFM